MCASPFANPTRIGNLITKFLQTLNISNVHSAKVLLRSKQDLNSHPSREIQPATMRCCKAFLTIRNAVIQSRGKRGYIMERREIHKDYILRVRGQGDTNLTSSRERRGIFAWAAAAFSTIQSYSTVKLVVVVSLWLAAHWPVLAPGFIRAPDF
jgi:hypothetical protein